MSDRVINVNDEIKSVEFNSQDVDQHIIKLTISCQSDDDVKTIAMLFHYKQLIESAENYENIVIEGDSFDEKLKNAYVKGRKDERANISSKFNLVSKKK